MINLIKFLLQWMLKNFSLILTFFFGVGLIVASFGFNFSQIPGDLGDSRFNMYILEHFFQWLQHPETNYWQANFFYPFPFTMAFSDNLLGSAPIYAVFRFIGVSRETAYQGWYFIGFILNFLAAAYVLKKLELKPFASGFGAFFFAFGLPMLVQEGHPQLIYRFCVPLACYFLWKFTNSPNLKIILVIFAMIVWQFYLTIYIGFFLSLLLLCMFLIFPFFGQKINFKNLLLFWPNRFSEAWHKAQINDKIFFLFGDLICCGLLLGLIYPYYQVSILYPFTRSINEVTSMLPRWQSYFLADHSLLWQPVSKTFTNLPMRHEHQLFPGIAVCLLLISGIVIRKNSNDKPFVITNLISLILLMLFTMWFNGFSLYTFFIQIPGVNSIRAVTRIQLVLMWPLAVYTSYVLNRLMDNKKRLPKLFSIGVVVLLVVEVLTFSHYSFSKRDSQIRIANLRDEIRNSLDIYDDSIIYIGSDPTVPWYVSEIDAMFVALELGIPTLNGYSGSLLHGAGIKTGCDEIPFRIINYMQFSEITDKNYYLNTINRVIPWNVDNCVPQWLDDFPLAISP